MTTPNLTPPNTGMHPWLQQLYRWLMQQQLQDQAPKPARLAYLTAEDRPVDDGILMWDPAASEVVVSKAGAWVPL